MTDQKISWYKSVNFKGVLVLCFVVASLVGSILVLMNTKWKTVVLNESSQLIEQIGNNMVSDLNTRSQEIASLTKTMATVAEQLSRNEDISQKYAMVMQVFPELIDFKGNTDIAGGGVWPEPYTFAPLQEKRSFFWGRNVENTLQFYEEYNLSKAGYHHEDWYVVARYLERGRCSWSKSYMDPFSLQPMVTATVAIYEEHDPKTGMNPVFSGTVTIDLKLEGLQAFAEYWQKRTGGYVFITDQYNTFITFPDPSVVRRIKKDEEGKDTQEFLTADEFAENEPLFAPIANTLKQMNLAVIDKARQMPGYKPELIEQIDQDSYKISPAEAGLIAAIVADPFVKQTFYDKIEIEQDFMNQERSFVYTFYVPQSYWKVVIVKPFSEATSVSFYLSRLLLRYISITVIIVLVVGYLLFDWLLLRPTVHITAAVRKVSDLVTKRKLNELKQAEIPYTSADEFGMLSACVNSLVSEFECSYQELTATNEELTQQIRKHVRDEDALLTENKELKAGTSGHIQVTKEEGMSSEDYHEELHKQRQIITKQHDALKQHDAPVIYIWEGILAVPHITTLQKDTITHILQNISRWLEKEHVDAVIMSMTAMPVLDAQETADHVMKLVQAVRFMGIKCLMVGIPLEVAEILVGMNGDEVKHMPTFSRIEQAIRHVVIQRQYEVVTLTKNGK